MSTSDWQACVNSAGDRLCDIIGDMANKMTGIFFVASEPDHKIKFAGKNFISIATECGTDPAQIIGYAPWEVIPNMQGLSQESFQTVTQTGQTLRLQDLRLTCNDHTTHWDIWLIPYVAPDTGAITSMAGVGLDVTSHIALRERHRLLFENMRELVSINEMIYDDSGQPINWIVEDVNPAFEQNIGVMRDKLIGSTLNDALDYEVPPEPNFSVYKRVVETGEPAEYERRVEELGLELRISAIPLGGNRFAAISTDITSHKKAQAEVESERRRLKAVVDLMPVGVVIAEADGRIVMANEQADKIWGVVLRTGSWTEYGEFRGWWADTGEQLTADQWALARAIHQGETSIGEIIDIENFAGKKATIMNSCVPMRDDEGKIVGAIATMQDVTEQMMLREALEMALSDARTETRRRTALELIAEAGISTLELGDLLTVLTERIAISLEVDSCTMAVLNDATGEIQTHLGYDHIDAQKLHLSEDDEFAEKVARSRQTISISDINISDEINDPYLESIGIRSVLGTPLIARGRVVGVARVHSREVRTFSADEIRLFEAMSAKAALAIDNACLHEELKKSLDREKHFSLLLQRALLPQKLALGSGYSVAVRYIPAYEGCEIGGDFYDVFRTDDGKACILIGDVSGKGLEAASLAATTRSTIHAFAHETSDPAEVLSRANSVLYPRQPEFSPFVTALLVIIDMQTGYMRYATAGHPPAAIYRQEGSVEFLAFGNLPLMFSKDTVYQEWQSNLASHDKLLLYTDGISEARRNGDLFESEGIEGALRSSGMLSAEDIAQSIVDAAYNWTNGRLRDDAAVVVVEREY